MNKQKESEGKEMTNLKEKRCLIAYFSREGNNYVSGKIVNLPVGNTKVVADIIHEMTGGDVFHIDTVKSYPEDYTETTGRGKKRTA
jgi:flavodoxin